MNRLSTIDTSAAIKTESCLAKNTRSRAERRAPEVRCSAAGTRARRMSSSIPSTRDLEPEKRCEGHLFMNDAKNFFDDRLACQNLVETVLQHGGHAVLYCDALQFRRRRAR